MCKILCANISFYVNLFTSEVKLLAKKNSEVQLTEPIKWKYNPIMT